MRVLNVNVHPMCWQGSTSLSSAPSNHLSEDIPPPSKPNHLALTHPLCIKLHRVSHPISFKEWEASVIKPSTEGASKWRVFSGVEWLKTRTVEGSRVTWVMAPAVATRSIYSQITIQSVKKNLSESLDFILMEYGIQWLKEAFEKIAILDSNAELYFLAQCM